MCLTPGGVRPGRSKGRAPKSPVVTVRALILVLALAAVVLGGRAPAVAGTTVTELQLPDGGIQRVLYRAPETPRAVLVMLVGGNGMVEIGQDGSIRRMGDSFLLRTLPL